MTSTEPGCTCPAQARAIVDALEAKVARNTKRGELEDMHVEDDRNPDVTGSSEPPD